MLPFAADAVSFVISAAFVSRLPRIPVASGPSQPIAAAIRAGLRHLRDTRELSPLVASMATYNFAYNVAMATFVLYATKILHVVDAGYGVLLAAAAVGGILSGWRAAPLTRNLSHRQVMAGSSITQGLVWLAIVLVPNVYTTGVFLALLGAASALTSVAVGSARRH
jgi:Na+/melibiose symporter-like transporter